jgi:hypothetical protein
MEELGDEDDEGAWIVAERAFGHQGGGRFLLKFGAGIWYGGRGRICDPQISQVFADERCFAGELRLRVALRAVRFVGESRRRGLCGGGWSAGIADGSD